MLNPAAVREMQQLQPCAAQHSITLLPVRAGGSRRSVCPRDQSICPLQGWGRSGCTWRQVLAVCGQSIPEASGITQQNSIGHHSSRQTRAAVSCQSQRKAAASDLTESSPPSNLTLPPNAALPHDLKLWPSISLSSSIILFRHPSAPAPTTSLLMHSPPWPPLVTRPRVFMDTLYEHSLAIPWTQNHICFTPAVPSYHSTTRSHPAVSPYPAVAFTAYPKRITVHLRKAELKRHHSWLTCTAGN